MTAKNANSVMLIIYIMHRKETVGNYESNTWPSMVTLSSNIYIIDGLYLPKNR
jgi:hypothetical protein